MPELPEVETTRRGIEPHILGRNFTAVVIRDARLRWPVAADLAQHLIGERVLAVRRRAKYLLIDMAPGTLIVHLGMSGSLRVVAREIPPQAYDHIDWQFDNGLCLRLRDPRRFGAALWTPAAATHPLLADLGPEPWDAGFTGAYLYRKSRKRVRAVKDFIMDSQIVAGVGNIYASEALFAAGIDPRRPAGRLSAPRYERLAHAIRDTLERAIAAGGTTLRDFLGSDGRPGYFRHALQVYGRAGAPCPQCRGAVKSITIGARSTFFCPRCQK